MQVEAFDFDEGFVTVIVTKASGEPWRITSDSKVILSDVIKYEKKRIAKAQAQIIAIEKDKIRLQEVITESRAKIHRLTIRSQGL